MTLVWYNVCTGSTASEPVWVFGNLGTVLVGINPTVPCHRSHKQAGTTEMDKSKKTTFSDISMKKMVMLMKLTNCIKSNNKIMIAYK